jgi:hypothetical protein
MSKVYWYILVYITTPCYILKAAFSPHKFTHPPTCCNSTGKFRNYRVMLPSRGITLQLNIENISELLPDLWWMDIRKKSATWHPHFKYSLSFVENAMI